MSDLNRRTFLGAAGALALASRAARSDSPGERIRLGIAGLRSRGTELARAFAKQPGVEIVALCDVDPATFAAPIKAVEAASGKAPRTESDFRKLLDSKEIDALVVATPDHWHALMAVMACQAGKDVYVEKPVSHNVIEGRRIVEAARKYGRVVQAGTQRRSTGYVRDAIDHLRSGALGKVGMARAWILKPRPSIGHGQVGPVPPGVDYAMWQGPAPDRPFMANRFHYNWHWFWNWGTGELGNNGIHGVDVARWGLDVDAPLAVTSGGGKFVFDDDQEVPDTQIVTWEYPGTCIVWEHRMWSNRSKLEGAGFGVAFYGEKGTLLVDDKGWRVEEGPKDARSGPPADGLADHLANFIDCTRTRKAPNASIEIGHASTRLCHLGNVAHRVGRKIRFDAATETITGDPEATALLSREYGPRFEMPSQV